MLYFVGAALIAGAVVHYPIDPPTYTAIAAIGAGVFLLGTIVNEFVFASVKPTLSRAVGLVAFSLLLSFGVGLLGGGIQHFEQFPDRSAAMTPIGLLMSYAAFIAKDPEGGRKHLFSWFGAAVAAVALVTWLGMSALADTIDTTGHDHGTTDLNTSETGVDSPDGSSNPGGSGSTGSSNDVGRAPSGEQQSPGALSNDSGPSVEKPVVEQEPESNDGHSHSH